MTVPSVVPRSRRSLCSGGPPRQRSRPQCGIVRAGLALRPESRCRAIFPTHGLQPRAIPSTNVVRWLPAMCVADLVRWTLYWLPLLLAIGVDVSVGHDSEQPRVKVCALPE
jgi:hypothetical protein